jgi:hypothetical protein
MNFDYFNVSKGQVIKQNLSFANGGAFQKKKMIAHLVLGPSF